MVTEAQWLYYFNLYAMVTEKKTIDMGNNLST